MSRAIELLLLCAGITGALLTIGGVLWWLVWPRIEDRLQEVARGVERVDAQLADNPDTLGRHAKVAASAAAELPKLREQLQGVVDAQRDVDRWRAGVDRRMGNVEGTLIALLGPELRRRLFTDLTGIDTHESESHT